MSGVDIDQFNPEAASDGISDVHTKTVIEDDLAIAAETYHGCRLYNAHASDAVVVNIRHGDDATATPIIPIAIAAGQSVNTYDKDGEAIGGGAGVFITDESAGSASIADLVGYIITGS